MSAARLAPSSLAIAALDSAHIGSCAVRDLAAFIDAIAALASNTAPLDLAEATKRIESIRRLAALATTFADDCHASLDHELEESNCALEALRAGTLQ